MSESSIKSFVTSATSADDAEPAGEPLTVDIDGRKVTFNPPDTNQIILITAAIEGASQDSSLAATMINAFFYMIDDRRESGHLKGRLFDPRDHFSLNNISEVLVYLLEEWSARPTGSSSDSSPSPSTSGTTSRARRHGHASHSGAATSPLGAP